MKIKPILIISVLLSIVSIGSIISGTQQKIFVKSPIFVTPQRAGGPPAAVLVNSILPNPTSSGSIFLSWNTSAGASWYYLYREFYLISSVAGLNYLVKTTNDSYTDIIANIGVYYYAVVAGNPTGNSSVSNCVNVTVTGNDWPMFHSLPTRTGIGVIPLGANFTMAWNTYLGTGGNTYSSPTVSAGRVYIGSNDNSTYCFNASSGAMIWNYTIHDIVGSSPAVSDGRVYIGCYNHKVYCLNATTGGSIWNYTTGNQIISSPTVVAGHVYVGSYDHKVYCLNATTGSSIWNYTTGNSIFSSQAIAGNYLFVTSYDQHVYCLNTTTGGQIWNHTIGNIIDTTPAVAGGCVYVGSEDHRVYCLNAITGRQIWNYTTGNMVLSSPAVVAGHVYVGSWDHGFYCLNATTGAKIWNYTTGNIVESSPAVAGGYVYVGSWDSKLYCLNTTTGGFVWSYATDASIFFSSPAVAGGCIYICGASGTLYCFKPTSVTSAPVMQLIKPNPNITGHVTIFWGPVAGAISYNVYRYTSIITGVNSSLTEFSAIGTVTVQDSLPSFGTYYYVVTAVNINGKSAISNCVSVLVYFIPSLPVLNTITPNPSINGSISLSWTASAGATRYYLFRATSTILSVTGLHFIANLTANSYTDVIGAVGTYYYAVIAANPAGNSSISNSQSVRVTALSSGPSSTPFTLQLWEIITIAAVVAVVGVVAVVVVWQRRKVQTRM